MYGTAVKTLESELKSDFFIFVIESLTKFYKFLEWLEKIKNVAKNG